MVYAAIPDKFIDATSSNEAAVSVGDSICENAVAWQAVARQAAASLLRRPVEASGLIR
jgi:hypothetical protein